jgi:hypothetical protein
MSKLQQDAIRELRQNLPLLKRLLQEFSHSLDSLQDPSEPFKQLHIGDIKRLEKSSRRIRELTYPEQFEIWVGGPITFDSKEKALEEVVGESSDGRPVLVRTTGEKVVRHIHAYTQRLSLYIETLLQSEQLEETLSRLTQENTNLKEQLAELRRRESIYLSIIREAQALTMHPLPHKSKEILLDSLQRQHTILTKNLCRLQEAKAQHGLNTPLDILNAIDQTQEDIRRVEATIGSLKADTTAAD